jgi:fructose PTS system EIIBC or EIIC component
MPVVVIPLFATLFAGGLMLLVLGRPLAAVTEGLESWLNGMTGTSALLLGVILGAMMAFDLGGPVNKAAYAFATAGLSGITSGGDTSSAPLVIMAAVMAAGMTPPLAMALATTVRPKLFSPAERENGKAAWLLGASFISEGAIPFAAADLFRVIPSMMVGSAATGAIIMGAGVTLRAPHGGIFVFFAMQHVLWFLIALAVGTALSAACVVLLKEIRARRSASVPSASYQRA